MGKYKRNASVVLTLIAGLLAVVAAVLYKGVMYRYQPVYVMLICAAVVAALHYVLAGFAPRLAAYLPIGMAALLASAAVWGTQLMVNQLGYVYAGLDPVSTIQAWVLFIACTVVAMLLSIVASFFRASLETR